MGRRLPFELEWVLDVLSGVRKMMAKLARGLKALLGGWRWIAWLLFVAALLARIDREPAPALIFQVALFAVGVYGVVRTRQGPMEPVGMAIACAAIFAAVALLIPFQVPRYLR